MRLASGWRRLRGRGQKTTFPRHERAAEPARPPQHVHWFRRQSDDPFSSASLYACRCGVVRPGM